VLAGGDYKITGEIGDTPGVHGVAIATALNRAYVSAGRSNVIVAVDLKTLARLHEIKTTGDGPDAVLYDPTTKQVFSFNGRGRNVTIIDAVKDEVVGTIAVDAKPEFGATDLAGHVYVNLEDKNSIGVIDAKQRTLA
jgi:DNA-binding beta-propeller fold protein YncE